MVLAGERTVELEGSPIPAPSGWDKKGKFKEGDIDKVCTVTSDTRVSKQWQITYGGAIEPTFAIVTSQESLNTVW